MLDTIGAALGPLIAFGLLWLVPGDFQLVLVVSLAFALLGVALLGLLAPDVRTRVRRDVRAGLRGESTPASPRLGWRDIADPRLRRLLVLAGLLGLLSVGDGFVYLALLDHGGFAATWFPLMYVGTNLAYLCLAIPMGRLADRFGRAKLLLLGHLALAGAYVCAVLPSTAAAATVGTLVLLGTFYAATDGVIAALASRLVPERARTSGIAAAQTVVALARMGASAGFGLLWLLLGPATAMVAVAFCLAVLVVLLARPALRLDAVRPAGSPA